MVNLFDFTFHKDSWKLSTDEVMSRLILGAMKEKTFSPVICCGQCPAEDFFERRGTSSHGEVVLLFR